MHSQNITPSREIRLVYQLVAVMLIFAYHINLNIDRGHKLSNIKMNLYTFLKKIILTYNLS